MVLLSNKRDGRELKVHVSVDELRSDLEEYIAKLSEASIRERGVFAIVLFGGSLIYLMGKFCEAPYNKTVKWTKWYVFWANKRVVAKSHADSNYKHAKDGFLSKVPIVHNQVHSINDTVIAEQAMKDYEFEMWQLVKTGVISVSETNDCPMAPPRWSI